MKLAEQQGVKIEGPKTLHRYEQLAAPTEELKPVFAAGRSARSLPILRPPASPGGQHSRRPLKSPPRATWREVFRGVGLQPLLFFGRIMPNIDVAGMFPLHALKPSAGRLGLPEALCGFPLYL